MRNVTSICNSKALLSKHGYEEMFRGLPVTNGASRTSNGEAEASKHGYQPVIDIVCDGFQGSPAFIERSGCTYFFEWHSTVACKSSPSTQAVHEVPCSLYDNNNQKRDLSPLIKQQGGHRVDSDTETQLFINVCRNITPGEGSRPQSP